MANNLKTVRVAGNSINFNTIKLDIPFTLWSVMFLNASVLVEIVENSPHMELNRAQS